MRDRGIRSRIPAAPFTVTIRESGDHPRDRHPLSLPIVLFVKLTRGRACSTSMNVLGAYQDPSQHARTNKPQDASTRQTANGCGLQAVVGC